VLALARTLPGIALILTGIIAIPIPILPGIPLIAAGAAMLGVNHPLVRAGREWLQRSGVSAHWRRTMTGQSEAVDQ